MKDRKELENDNKEKLDPNEKFMESWFNFESGMTVGFNPTVNQFKSVREKNMQISKRGVVKSTRGKGINLEINVRWVGSHRVQLIHYTKLKIYYQND